jgi:hypothetical protein
VTNPRPTFNNLDWTSTLSHLPTIAASALLAGVGARLAQRAVTPSPHTIPEEIRRVRSRVEELPVQVTKEQAEELRRRGIDVRTVKRAEVQPSAINAALYGLGAVGSAAAGWSLADYFTRSHDKSRARERVDRIRGRIERLLQDRTPEDLTREDAKLRSVIKLAAERHARAPGVLERAATSTAKGMQQVSDAAGAVRDSAVSAADAVVDTLHGLKRGTQTVLAGGAGILGALLAYGVYRGGKDAQRRRKDERDRLRSGSFDVLRQRHALAPMVDPVPYVVEDDDDEAEERPRIQPRFAI